MISYFDIRHSKSAMKNLQGKQLRRRKLDIHYSIPKDNPSEKDQNQGTLVVFNLDPSISCDELKEIFGAYGEIKEIRETPNKKHHKFIEFYDVREAENAMKHLNKTEIKSKKIKIEPSRPGGRKSSLGSDLVHAPSSPGLFSEGSLNLSNSTDSFLTSSSSSSTKLDRSGSHGQGEKQPFASRSPNLASQQSHRPRVRSVNPTVRNMAEIASSSMFSASADTQNLKPSRSISMPLEEISGSQKQKAPGPVNPVISPPQNRAHPAEQRTQFTLDIVAVTSGLERRTTLMIKNIPNKYTQKMLLLTVDEHHKGLYDFFYLPIDFKNKCNVGYAFINFIDPQSIVSFYQKLHNMKWEKFNSEKVCEIAFARIQGKEALIAHFQNSSLMSEDKKYRPLIFHSDGPNIGQQAPFPVGPNVRVRDKMPSVPGRRKEDYRSSGKNPKNGRTPRSRSFSLK